MKGTNPDGSKYADPVYWISYFNGGDAVHYFDRPAYGYYQSLGCVELPVEAGQVHLVLPDLRHPGHRDRSGGVAPGAAVVVPAWPAPPAPPPGHGSNWVSTTPDVSA